MSEGGAVALGALLGVVVVLAVFIAKRDEIARNWRLVRGKDSAEAVSGDAAPPRGIGVRTAVFCSVMAVLNIAIGVMDGQPLVLVSGIVLLVGAVAGAVMRTRGWASSRDQ